MSNQHCEHVVYKFRLIPQEAPLAVPCKALKLHLGLCDILTYRSEKKTLSSTPLIKDANLPKWVLHRCQLGFPILVSLNDKVFPQIFFGQMYFLLIFSPKHQSIFWLISQTLPCLSKMLFGRISVQVKFFQYVKK